MSGLPSSFRAFGEADGDLRDMAGRTIAFIGYGNQGRAQALNLRDSLRAESLDTETPIVVSTLRDETWTQAEADGFPVRPLPDVADEADVLFLLVPDEELPSIFNAQIAPNLHANDLLVFATGYNLAFDGVTPPPDVDVTMLAPRMIGRQLRQLFEAGKGFYSYVAVEQDASGRAWPGVLALAKGIGTLRLGAFELSARDEAVIDLWDEQGFGPIIGATVLVLLEVAKEAGLPLEALVLDTYLSGEMAQTFQAMSELGFVDQARLHSRTSQYGGMMGTLSIDREPIRQHLRRALERITNGEFVREWTAEQAAGCENFEKLRDLGADHNPFTPIEQRIREALREAQGRTKPTAD
jgi:ketol-acid reductoisomerase